jgi:hypothetical protein
VLHTESHFGGSNPSTTANIIMEILNIKEKDLSIIIPYKNGHTILYMTFIHLFKHLNIDISLEKKPNNFLNNVHIFVRNPVDRFFSSYFWLINMTKNGEDKYKQDILNLIKNTNSHNIDNYINRYDIFLKECDDFHYIPQSSQILYSKNKIYKNEIIDIKTDLKLLYDKKFGSEYKILKIEDIDTIIKNNMSSLINKNFGFDNKLDAEAFNESKFDFLKDYPSEVSFLFSTFYLYFKNIYKITNHHKNIDYTKEVKFTEYKTVCSLTENESIFFDYPTKMFDRNIFKKSLV